MVLVNQPLTRVVGVQWGSGYYYRLIVINKSPIFTCPFGSFLTQMQPVFFMKGLTDGEYPELDGGIENTMIGNANQLLGNALTEFEFEINDLPLSASIGDRNFLGAARSYGQPFEPSFDDFAGRLSAAWFQSGAVTNSETFRPGVRIGFTSWDPYDCDDTGKKVAFEMFAETWRMPGVQPAFGEPNEDALLPVGSELIERTETLEFPETDITVEFTEFAYFFRDEDKIARLRVGDFDGIDEETGLPEF